MWVLALIAKQENIICGLNINKRLPLKDVFFRNAITFNWLLLFLILSPLPSFHPFILHFLQVTTFEWQSQGFSRQWTLQQNTKQSWYIVCIKQPDYFCTLSHQDKRFRKWMDGWILTAILLYFFSSVWETRPCGQLQQSAVMSHWYGACRRLTQRELMYQDGILSCLVWFKMEVQQRRQVNCGLFGDFEPPTLKPQNEERGQWTKY